ncbi:hypothetical protein [Nocardiopsis lucentensis]|uniref:hypothetical protein n=1 Tax=Nocardiopsis lucentensis TaxID=53441 RepID=UPI00034AEE36|nr:hypothetical protein [Nocardiopsis lucentensis]
MVAVGLFACRVAWGLADLVVSALRHRAERVWSAPGRAVGPRARPGPDRPGGGVHRNEVRGDVSGTVVQAEHVGQVHIHAPPPDRTGADT